MRILVDAMGGDLAPDEIVKGAVHAQRELGAEIVLVGQRAAIETCLRNEQAELEIIDASEVITMDDDPSTATRRKKDASMTVALNLLRDGKGDAVVSAGSTGALLTGATLIVKRIHGIRRAALAPVLPNGDAGVMLIDCGANADCTPEYLLQFAYMGSYYARTMLGIAAPRVGLLSNGTEDHKGAQLQHETFPLLKAADAAGRIRFIGNVEASQVFNGDVDVVVTDGFTGNVTLKTIEGTSKVLFKMVKEAMMSSAKAKIGALALKSELYELKDRMSADTYGGAPLLGCKGAVVVGHGSSNAKAVKNGILVTARAARENVSEIIAQTLAGSDANNSEQVE